MRPAAPRVRGDAGAGRRELLLVRPEGHEGDAGATEDPDGRLRGLPRPPARACACSTPPAARGNFLYRRPAGAQGPRVRGDPVGLARRCSRPMQFPQIGPEAVLGIEINAYAAELARVTIWIGEIQWMLRHGLGYRRDPILRPLDHIETPRRAARPLRPDEPARGGVAGGRVHRRQPAVPGRQAAAARPRRRVRRDALFASSTAGCPR